MFRTNRLNRFRLLLDQMEARDCPAVTCVNTNGALQILGDAGANTVVVDCPAAGVVNVTGDGQSFSFQGIQSMSIMTGDGNDRVTLVIHEGQTPFGVNATVDLGAGDDTLDLTVLCSTTVNFAAGPLPASAPITVQATGNIGTDRLGANIVSANAGAAMLLPAVQVALDGGAGDDYVATQMNNMVLRRAATFTETGGDGNDQISFDANTNNVMAPLTVNLDGGIGDDQMAARFDTAGPRSVYNSTITVKATGDAGNDTINLALGGYPGPFLNTTDSGNTSDPVINGKFNFTLDGGDGADTIAASAHAAPQGVGTLIGQVLGGTGDDDLTLDLSAVPTTFKATGLIDGGDGTDTHHSSPTVTVLNCEL